MKSYLPIINFQIKSHWPQDVDSTLRKRIQTPLEASWWCGAGGEIVFLADSKSCKQWSQLSEGEGGRQEGWGRRFGGGAGGGLWWKEQLRVSLCMDADVIFDFDEDEAELFWGQSAHDSSRTPKAADNGFVVIEEDHIKCRAEAQRESNSRFAIPSLALSSLTQLCTFAFFRSSRTWS